MWLRPLFLVLLTAVCLITGFKEVMAEPPLWDSTVAYITTDGVVTHDCDTVTLTFRIHQDVSDDSLARFDAGWIWNGSRLTAVDWREGPGMPGGEFTSPGVTTDSRTLHFARHEFDAVLDSSEAILEIDFVASCLIQDPVVEVPFWFDTLGRASTMNIFYRRVSRVYWPVDRRAGQIHLAGVSTSCGDLNDDGQVTSADIITFVGYVFRSGPPPGGTQGDVNCDGRETASDIVLMVNFVFKGGI
jgi:hypothetical protein